MTDRLTKEQEDALRAAEAAATPGRWHQHFHMVCDHENEAYARTIAECLPFGSGDLEFANSGFIVAARNAMPALLAELDALRAEKQRLVDAVFAIYKSAAGGHSYEVTLTNMFWALSAALDLAAGVKPSGGNDASR